MEIRFMFQPLTTLMSILLIFSMPFVTLAQQNPVQTEAKIADVQDIDALRLEAKTAAEQDANNDSNTKLWFLVGVGICCIGSTAGGVAGFCVGSIINPKWDSSELYGGAASLPVPNTTQIVGTLVGVAVGVLGPPINIYNNPPSPPPERLIGKSPEYVKFYTDAYKVKVRSLRTKSVVTGVGCGGMLLGCLMVAQ